MDGGHVRTATRQAVSTAGVLGWLAVLMVTAHCARQQPPPAAAQGALRVGVGALPQSSSQAGVRQLVANLSLEGLVNLNQDGRPRPFLAESWETSPDGLTITMQLRRGARYQDGTAVTAPLIVRSLQTVLPSVMGPAFEDIAAISAADDQHVLIRMRQPSPFAIEALETTLQKPDTAGMSTGPYVGSSASELRANKDYYLGRPEIDRIALNTYPSIRAAWAELLRGNLDMLYEVNIDALDSLQGSSNVTVFSFVRHYQYMVIFGSENKELASPEVRRELSAALDRDVLVQKALNTYGVPSTGPISLRHWALSPSAPRLGFNRDLAKKLTARHLRFTCLVPADTSYERLALQVKQQFASVGVEMNVEERTQEKIVEALRSGNFEAALVDGISGPSMFRLYQRWHTGGPFNLKSVSNSRAIDAALDDIRHARNDDEYRAGVARLQTTAMDDPPAVFLTWAERARAVSRRFDVPAPEQGRDVLATLRLWRPVAAQQLASRN
jgi:peptide/nickel transport system substrate-binding protein